MSSARLIHVDDSLPGQHLFQYEDDGTLCGVARKAYVHPAMLAAQERGDFAAAAGPLPRATRYVSRYERGFLSYLERAPGAAALLRSA